MGKLFFVCPDYKAPAGGIKQIYRQVEVLNNNGFEATVLHGNKPFKIDWFESNAPVTWDYRVNNLKKTKKRKIKSLIKSVFSFPKAKKSVINFKQNDIIVLPEYYGKELNNAFLNQSLVIYNQNCYYTFRGYNYHDFSDQSIYKQERLKAVIVASEDALGYLGMFFNKNQLFRVKYGIDHDVFSFSKVKKKQIAFMPRKLKEDAVQIFNILNHKRALDDWKLIPIEGLNEIEVAKILKESAIFLSFNHREGFGMPPAEAMACGCIVVGYAGQGGKEVLNPEFSYPIEDRNIKSFVINLIEVMNQFNNDAKFIYNKGKLASNYILENYSMKTEEQTILSTWNKIIDQNN